MGRGGRAALAVAALITACGVVAGAALLAGGLFGADSNDSTVDTASDTSFQGQIPRLPQRGAVTIGPCTYSPENRASVPNVPMPSEADVATTGAYEVELMTSVGRVAFAVDAAKVPCALGSIRSLARAGYFDGSSCHRLTTGDIKVLQCGDPTGFGNGGPGYVFDDEALAGATYPAGTVAMANRGPNTNGSQFFFVYGASQLAPDYTPLGRITAGLDLLQRVASAGSNDNIAPGDGQPKVPVVLQRVTVRAR